MTRPVEIREERGGEWLLLGYASVLETDYPMSGWVESITRGAFRETLGKAPDVSLLVGHTGLALARTTSGTLSLSEDATGLLVEARLDRRDPEVISLRHKMNRGDVSEMSFGFRVQDQHWSQDFTRRWIQKVDLDGGDVSIVNNAANPATSAVIAERDRELSLEQRQRRAASVGNIMRGVLPGEGYGDAKRTAQLDRRDEAMRAWIDARIERLKATDPLNPGDNDLAEKKKYWLARRAAVRAEEAKRERERVEALRLTDCVAERHRLLNSR